MNREQLDELAKLVLAMGDLPNDANKSAERLNGIVSELAEQLNGIISEFPKPEVVNSGEAGLQVLLRQIKAEGLPPHEWLSRATREVTELIKEGEANG